MGPRSCTSLPHCLLNGPAASWSPGLSIKELAISSGIQDCWLVFKFLFDLLEVQIFFKKNHGYISVYSFEVLIFTNHIAVLVLKSLFITYNRCYEIAGYKNSINKQKKNIYGGS